MQIELPPQLIAEIAQGIEALAGSPAVSQYRTVCGVAQRAIGFYQKRVPELFADHAAEFYRERPHALEAGNACDASASLAGWRNHAHSIEMEQPMPENIAWLKMILEKVSSGQLHLRK